MKYFLLYFKYLAIVGLIIILGIWDLKKQFAAQRELKEKISILMLDNKKSVMIAKPEVFKSIAKEKLISTFLLAMQNSGLASHSIMMRLDEKNELAMDIVLWGDFLKINQLLKNISNAGLVGRINHLSLLSTQGQLKVILKMVFKMMVILTPPQNNFFLTAADLEWSDPFFISSFSFEDKRVSLLWQNYPIQQIKRVGYIKIANHIDAIITQPSGDAMRVRVGDRLGKEKILLKAITENNWTLESN